MTNERLEKFTQAWELYLGGHDTTEISLMMNWHVRQVQQALKWGRECFPAAVVDRAVKAYVRKLKGLDREDTTCPAVVYCDSNVIKNVYRVFKRHITAKQIANMIAPAGGAAVKKSAKPNNIPIKGSSITRAKAPVKAVAATTTENKRVFKQELKRLVRQRSCTDVRTCKKTDDVGVTRVTSFTDFLEKSLRENPVINAYCNDNGISIEDLIKQLTREGLVSQLIDQGIADGLLVGMYVVFDPQD